MKKFNLESQAGLAISKIKDTIPKIMELDNMLTKISKTSRLAEKELKQLGTESYLAARRYGKDASDYLSSLQRMSQSGFHGEAGMGMAEQSLLAQSAGGMEQEIADKYILAANAAYKFNGEASKINEVLDGQNNISSRNKIALKEIASAMVEAGAAASNYNVTIEELSAMIATMESITRSGGSEVGNSIKTLLTNLQNAGSDKITDTLDKANASMTEMAGGAEQLRNPISILRDLAKTFSQLNENDPLKAEILANIGGQEHAAQLSALLQNMNMFDKMLVDYSEGKGSAFEAANKSANNLSGTLNKLSNSWSELVGSMVNSDVFKTGANLLDSMIQGATKLVSVITPLGTIGAGAGLFASLKNTGIFKTFDSETDKISSKWGIMGRSFNEIGTSIIKKIDNIKKGFQATDDLLGSVKDSNNNQKRFYTNKESIQSKLVNVDALYSKMDDSLANKILNKLQKQQTFVDLNKSSWIDYYKTLKEGEKWQIDFVKNTDLQKASLNDIKNAYKKARQSAISHNNALKQQTLGAKAATVATHALATAGNIVAGVLLSMVVGQILQGIDNYIHRVENAKEALNDFYNSFKESEDELQSQKQWIEQNSKEYEELAKGVDKYGHNISLTTDEFARYNSLTKEIAEMFPDMVKGYNDQNQAILKNKGNVDALTKSYEKNEKAYYASIRVKSGEVFSDYKTEIESEQDKKNILGNLINNKDINTKTYFGNPGIMYVLFKDILDTSTLEQFQEEVKEKFIKDNGFIKSYKDFDFSELSLELRQKIIDAYAMAQNTIDAETEKVRPILEAYLYGASSGYDSLDENAKQAVQTFIHNIGSEFYSQFDSEVALQLWMKENIIKTLQDGADASDLAIRFQTLFTLDENDFDSYQNYINAVQNILNALAKMKSKNGEKLFSKEQMDGFSMQMGVSGYDIDGNITGQNLIDEVKGKFKEIKDANNFIDSLSQEELRILYRFEPDKETSLADLRAFIDENLKTKNEEPNTKFLSFNKAWKDTADETKQELLELARAGEISEETLESTEKYSHLLSETGMSAKRVKDNITDMLTTQEKLSAFSNGMSSLQSAYQEFQDKKFVTASTLEGLPNVLKQMNGGKDFDLFSRIAGDPSSGSQKIKKAFDDIITAYLKNQNTLVGVTQKTKSAVIANLKDAGVSNAAEIVNSYINNVNRGKAIMAQAAAELENKSNAKRQADLNNFQELLLKKDISFAEACNALGGKNAALMQLLGVQYSEDYIKWTQLLSNKISAYNRMVDAINAAGVADDFSNAPYASARAAFEAKYKMSPEEYVAKNNPLNKPFLQRVKQDKDYELAVSIILNEKAAKEEQKQKDKILNKLNRAKPVDFNGITYNGSSSGDKAGKTQQEKSYQLIDWIARKLETLQSKIDLTKAKFENLFALKSKKDNLSTQIKQTTKLLHKQEKAAKKYQKIANKYAKTNKINKKTIKQVKNGSLNIKKYESKIVEIIQTYQDYYDKAKAAEKAAIEAKKAIRELKKERNQLYIDRADSKLSAIDAQVENQKTVKGKNKYLQKKVEWIKEYYYYQIKNAELEKNETKAAEFRAQRKKALRDLEIQQHQNRADDREAHFNLNQKRAENATNAKDKNKYEETSLQNLQDQYRWKAEIARLEHGEKSAEYKLVKEEEKSEIRAAYKRMYDNIKSEYDNLTSLNDAQIATVQAKIATLEAAGKSASKEMYLEMMKISSDTEEKLINKRAELAESGKNLESGSDEWYTWKDDMESIEQSLYSCKQNTIEWQKAVNELDLKKFSLMAAQLDATKNHLDFLVGMLSHQDLTSKESGGLTDAGFATISLRFSSIDNQNETIENAREKLKKIYENHLNGTDGLTEEEFLETKEKELDVIRNALEAIADEKDAILDLVDNAMQVQIDSINELIEKKKKALATEKDLYEYQKKVAKQTNNITLIQKQIAALSGDNSEEARAKLQKLQVSLEEAQEDLKDTEYDRWHDDQSDMLDSLSEEVENFWEKMMNDLRKDIDGSMDKLMQMLTDNPEAITRALDSLGLGDALSIITTYNKDGTHTEHSIDYGGTSYESTHQNNTGTNVNNQLDTDPKNPDSPSGGTDSSSGNPENTIRDLASITDEEMKRWMEALLQNKSEEEKKRKQEEEAKKKREEEKKLVYLRAEDIMHDKANGQMNGIAFRGTISAQAERDVIEEFLNSSALHKPATETGKQRMKTDPLLKYIAEIYSGKTLSNANEALLGAYLGIQVKDKNNVTTKEANKILKAFQKAGFAKGGIASGLNAAVIRNGDDGLITVKRGESILTVEQTERFQKLTDNLDLLNSMTEYAAQIPDYSQMVGCHTVNSPVTVGDVSIHLDGSNVVDKETFRKTLREYDVRSDIEQIALGDISTGTIRNSLKRI